MEEKINKELFLVLIKRVNELKKIGRNIEAFFFLLPIVDEFCKRFIEEQEEYISLLLEVNNIKLKFPNPNQKKVGELTLGALIERMRIYGITDKKLLNKLQKFNIDRINCVHKLLRNKKNIDKINLEIGRKMESNKKLMITLLTNDKKFKKKRIKLSTKRITKLEQEEDILSKEIEKLEHKLSRG